MLLASVSEAIQHLFPLAASCANPIGAANLGVQSTERLGPSRYAIDVVRKPRDYEG